MKGTVENIFTRSEGKTTPVLLKFQNGDLINSHKDRTLYFPALCREDKTKHAVVVTSGNVYSGQIGESVTNDLTDTYICIKNKTTSKVRILPIDQVKLINQVFEEKQKSRVALLSNENAQERMVRTFGGRRDLRNLAHKERNKVNVDVVKDQLETTVDTSTVLDTKEEIASTEEIVDRIRPKFNKDATHLMNVYSVYDVIPLELMDRLDEEVTMLLSTDIDDIPIKSEYLRKTITSLTKSTQTSQTILKMKMIIYMDALLTLMKSRAKLLNKLELSKITEKVENDIRERFSDQNSIHKNRSSFTNEKALCYFLVLGFLLSDDFELDIDMLAQELCMSKAKILKYGHLVNATIKASKNALTLRLPSTVKAMGNAFVGKRKK